VKVIASVNVLMEMHTTCRILFSRLTTNQTVVNFKYAYSADKAPDTTIDVEKYNIIECCVL